MERMLSWMRENPQFAAISFFVAVLAIVMTILMLAMSRAGVSLRPIVWFLGFVAIVAGPQAVVHFFDGVVIQRARAGTKKTASLPEPTKPTATSTLSPVPWTAVFGPKADPALITDAKRGLEHVFQDALEAKLSFSSDGQSAAAARFSSAEAAAAALNRYGQFFMFAGAQGNDASGWTARRHNGQGEWVHVVTAGPELYAWTAMERQHVIERREQALGPIGEISGTSEKDTAQSASAQPVSQRLRQNTRLMVLFLSLNLMGATLWFFKGSAWAARVDGTHEARPVGEAALRSELLALNRSEIPTEVTSRPDGLVEINWRYADAKWFDLMRVHQMKRVHRMVLSFDEANRVVRVREYWSALDASLSPRDLRLDWKAATGIQFFAFDHTGVLGVQLGADGKPTGELSKAYTFDLQALKQPYIAAVTRAGWHWQPLTWNAPKAFRWLTE